MDGILDARYHRIEGSVDKVIHIMDRNGMARQLRMHRSSQAFDFQPVRDLFERILNSNRERLFLELHKEMDHVAFETARFQAKIDLHRANPKFRSVVEKYEELAKLHRRNESEITIRRAQVLKETQVLKDRLDAVHQSFIFGTNMRTQCRHLFHNVKSEIQSVRSDVQTTRDSYPMVFEQARRDARVGFRKLQKAVCRSVRQRIAQKEKALSEQVEYLSSRNRAMQEGLALILQDRSGSNDMYAVIQAMVHDIRFQAVDREQKLLGMDESADVVLYIMTTRKNALREKVTQYQTRISRARRNRRALEVELKSLNAKLAKLESPRKQKIVDLDIELSHESFEEATRRLDETLRTLSETGRRPFSQSAS
jgi:uncharacterized coiled-coil DUF342 family protein